MDNENKIEENKPIVLQDRRLHEPELELMTPSGNETPIGRLSPNNIFTLKNKMFRVRGKALGIVQVYQIGEFKDNRWFWIQEGHWENFLYEETVYLLPNLFST